MSATKAVTRGPLRSGARPAPIDKRTTAEVDGGSDLETDG